MSDCFGFTQVCSRLVPRMYHACITHVPGLHLPIPTQLPGLHLACTSHVPGFRRLCPAFLLSAFCFCLVVALGRLWDGFSFPCFRFQLSAFQLFSFSAPPSAFRFQLSAFPISAFPLAPSALQCFCPFLSRAPNRVSRFNLNTAVRFKFNCGAVEFCFCKHL